MFIRVIISQSRHISGMRHLKAVIGTGSDVDPSLAPREKETQ